MFNKFACPSAAASLAAAHNAGHKCTACGTLPPPGLSKPVSRASALTLSSSEDQFSSSAFGLPRPPLVLNKKKAVYTSFGAFLASLTPVPENVPVPEFSHTIEEMKLLNSSDTVDPEDTEEFVLHQETGEEQLKSLDDRASLFPSLHSSIPVHKELLDEWLIVNLNFEYDEFSWDEIPTFIPESTYWNSISHSSSHSNSNAPSPVSRKVKQHKLKKNNVRSGASQFTALSKHIRSEKKKIQKGLIDAPINEHERPIKQLLPQLYPTAAPRLLIQDFTSGLKPYVPHSRNLRSRRVGHSYPRRRIVPRVISTAPLYDFSRMNTIMPDQYSNNKKETLQKFASSTKKASLYIRPVDSRIRLLPTSSHHRHFRVVRIANRFMRWHTRHHSTLSSLPIPLAIEQLIMPLPPKSTQIYSSFRNTSTDSDLFNPLEFDFTDHLGQLTETDTNAFMHQFTGVAPNSSCIRKVLNDISRLHTIDLCLRDLDPETSLSNSSLTQITANEWLADPNYRILGSACGLTSRPANWGLGDYRSTRINGHRFSNFGLGKYLLIARWVSRYSPLNHVEVFKTLIPACGGTIFFVWADDFFTNSFFSEKNWYSTGQELPTLSQTDADSAPARNSFTIRESFTLPSHPGLLGAQVVPTEFLLSTPAPSSNSIALFGTHSKLPQDLIRTKLSWDARGASHEASTDGKAPYIFIPSYVKLSWASRFRVNYGSESREFPEIVTENLDLVAVARDSWYSNRSPPAVETILLPLHVKPASSLDPRFSALQALYSNDLNESTRRALEDNLSPRRGLGARQVRLQGSDYEQARLMRFLDLQQMFQRANQGQRYLRLASILQERHYVSRLFDSIKSYDSGFIRRQQQAADPLARDTIVYIGTTIEQSRGTKGWRHDQTDPEFALWEDPTLIADLMQGRAAFIDAEGLSIPVIRELIRAFLPQEQSSNWGISYEPASRAAYTEVTPVDPPPTADEIAAGAKTTKSKVFASVAKAEFDVLYSQFSKYTIHGATRVVIHWGNTPVDRIPPPWHFEGDDVKLAGGVRDGFKDPSPGNNSNFNKRLPEMPIFQNLNPYNLKPDFMTISMAIRSTISTRACAQDFLDAIDLHAYHTFGTYNPRLDGNVVNNSGRHKTIRLPRDYSMMNYFDYAYSLLPVPEYISNLLTCEDESLFWSYFFTNAQYAASINWPMTTFTLSANDFDRAAEPVPTGFNKEHQEHIRQMFHTFRSDQVSTFTAAHRRAMFTMYGACPSQLTSVLLSSERIPGKYKTLPVFDVNPYFIMWSCKMLPLHFLLPLPNTAPLWPKNEHDHPVTGPTEKTNFVRLGRSLPPFAGFNWVGDGGMNFSLQHYLNANSEYSPGTDDLRAHYLVATWKVPFQREPNANPSYLLPQYISENTGSFSSVFSSFVVPGSVRSYGFKDRRVHATGISYKASNSTGLDEFLTAMTSNVDRMTMGMTNLGKSIECISPYGFNREYESTNQYSAITIYNERNNSFSGIGITSLEGLSMYQSSMNTSLSFLDSGENGTYKFPAYLANHNDINYQRSTRGQSGGNSSQTNVKNTNSRGYNKVKRQGQSPQISYNNNNPSNSTDERLPNKGVTTTFNPMTVSISSAPTHPQTLVPIPSPHAAVSVEAPSPPSNATTISPVRNPLRRGVIDRDDAGVYFETVPTRSELIRAGVLDITTELFNSPAFVRQADDVLPLNSKSYRVTPKPSPSSKSPNSKPPQFPIPVKTFSPPSSAPPPPPPVKLTGDKLKDAITPQILLPKLTDEKTNPSIFTPSLAKIAETSETEYSGQLPTASVTPNDKDAFVANLGAIELSTDLSQLNSTGEGGINPKLAKVLRDDPKN